MAISLIGISGSLRRDSLNSRLLLAAQRLCPDGTTLDIHSIEAVPLYNFDVEKADGIPETVAAIKDAIAAADGLLIATPEYNGSMPGVLKNAIDWLSRPADDIPRVFRDKCLAIVGATPGGLGTVLAQNAWLPVFRALGMRLWTGGRYMVPHATKVIGDDGHFEDPAMEKRLASFLDGFVGFCHANKAEQR